MKHVKHLLFLSILCSIVLFNSCGDSDDPVVVEARRLKSEMLRLRRDEVTAFVSKSLYESSARLLDNGETSWTNLE